MWALQKRTGFTIVELLIVIVVIAILAAITIVAFNGVQDRAKVSKAQSDLAATHKLLELYKAQYGEYPQTASAAWSFQGTNPNAAARNTYIAGLVPEFTNNLPVNTDSSGQYVYRSNGVNFKIIKYRGGGLFPGEWSQVPDAMKDQMVASADRYGLWSPGGSNF